MKAALRLLCISMPQRTQSTWSTPRKALCASGIRGTQKYLRNHQTAHQTGPSQRGQPKPPLQSCHLGTPGDPSDGTASCSFWDSTAAAASEGLCSMWNTLTTILSSYSSVLTLQGIFVFIQYHLISCHT